VEVGVVELRELKERVGRERNLREVNKSYGGIGVAECGKVGVINGDWFSWHGGDYDCNWDWRVVFENLLFSHKSTTTDREKDRDEEITVKTVEALYMQFNFGFVWGPLDLSDCLFFQSITTCISNGFLHLKIIILFLKYFKYINIFLS